MKPGQTDEYREYVAAKTTSLRRLAYLVCGDWHRAEDATQDAFVRLYLKWSKCAATDSIDSYVRRMVINAAIDTKRRMWFRKEQSKSDMPDRSENGTDAPTERVAVLKALACLPRRQRATVVLRFWEDLSVEQTARIMRCSTSTVKSQTAKGLRSLRELLTDSFQERLEGAVR